MNRWLNEENRLPVENPSDEDLQHLDPDSDSDALDDRFFEDN